MRAPAVVVADMRAAWVAKAVVAWTLGVGSASEQATRINRATWFTPPVSPYASTLSPDSAAYLYLETRL